MAVLVRLLKVAEEMARYLDSKRGADLTDMDTWLAVLHALQVNAQALLDAVTRAAALASSPGETYRDAAYRLRDAGLLGDDDVAFVLRVLGFRNIVVHRYGSVDAGVVRGILERGEYWRVVRIIARLVEAFKDP